MLQSKNGGERAEGSVYCRAVREDVQHFRIDHGDVRALSIPRRGDASFCGGEVVLRPHCIAVTFPVSLPLHNLSARWPSRASRKSAGYAAAARQRPPPTVVPD